MAANNPSGVRQKLVVTIRVNSVLEVDGVDIMSKELTEVVEEIGSVSSLVDKIRSAVLEASKNFYDFLTRDVREFKINE